MRLIDADALKEELGDTRDGEPIFRDTEFIRMDVIEEAIDQAPTMERPLKEPKQGEWIPCSERLPEEQKDVLVWYEYFRYGSYNRMFQTYGVARLYGDFWSGDVQGTNAKCIAWMPLPEPYQKEGETE